MKNFNFLLIAILIISSLGLSAQVAVTTDGSSADPSAMLDIKSTTSGLLTPRMTAAERDLIGTPATGLMVFVTDDASFYFYNGSTWDQVGGNDDDWQFNGSEIYRSGNVGIGTTTNPSFPIDVVGAGGERIRAFSQDGIFAGYLSKNNTREFFAGVQATYETPNTTSGYHIFDNTAGAQRMVIDELGNMGVGVSNPTAKLDVNGTINGTNFTGNGNTLTFGNNSNMQPSLAVSYIIALVGYYPSPSASTKGIDPYIGEITMFAGNYAPNGWAFCNGQLLPISSYSALFSILGTTYGGDGETTFALPDLRGRAPIHQGNAPGLTNRPLGQKIGLEKVGQ
jgi:microcystin-dependent protein